MTIHEISEFLSKNDRRIPNKLTRMILKDGTLQIGHFLQKFQTVTLMDNNRWIFFQGTSIIKINVKGKNVKSLKEN